MKNLKTFNEYLNEAIVVNRDAASKEIERLTKEVRQQIIEAGKRGQESVVLNFEGSDYSSGSSVMDSLGNLVKIVERGFSNNRRGNYYEFNVSCDIVDTKLINKAAQKKAIEEAIKDAIKQAETAAKRGSENVVISWDVPNYGDGDQVQKALEAEGVYCNERGYESNKNSNGSYTFNQRSTIKG